MRRSYRFRLYPTGQQERDLVRYLDATRELYNSALEQRRTLWREHGVSVSLGAQAREIKTLRDDPALAEMLDGLHVHALQCALKQLDLAFEAFCRRCRTSESPGYPRFKNARRWNSFAFKEHGNGFRVHEDTGRLRITGVGHVKVKLHRRLPHVARICSARICRRNDKWYVSLALDGVATRPLPANGRQVGIDVGITTFAATSDGELIAGPRPGRAKATKVRRAARKVARRKRGSNRRRKAVALLAGQREREANIRRDHAHKTARSLMERFDLIAIENLNFRGLTGGMLARDCSDQGWAQFAQLLAEKAEDAARELVVVDAKHTSQACSACGAIVPKPLSQRVHSCACGYRADRDINAARNILARATGPDGAIRRQRWGEEARAVA